MPEPPTTPSPPATETDARFPSGEWVGHWLQRPKIKGKMELLLTFKDGLIQGEGRDLVGEFLMRGHYETKSGKVVMTKNYLKQHQVHYSGWAEDGKGIWGVWQIRGSKSRGGWHIWPRGMADPTGSTLKAAVEEPVEVLEEAGVH